MTLFPHIVPAKDNLKIHTSALVQLVSLAWGFNEVTDEYMDKVTNPH